LYAWLYARRDEDSTLIRDLTVFLALGAMAEGMGYPKLAKLYHKGLGTFESTHSRVVDYDPFERHWAADVLLDHIERGTERFRSLIAVAG
ncbi:MAG: dihydrodipicolinate synthase family protein, partial [Hyphomicrobiaceae bacterium]